MNLDKVVYSNGNLGMMTGGTKNQWIDIGGRKNWRKYSFPALRFDVEEAQDELGLANETVVICALRDTIPLIKLPDGTYRYVKDIPSQKMELLDNTIIAAEKSSSCIYRTIRGEVYTDIYDYNLSLPFLDKDATVHIFNDFDCRSIQYVEQYVEGSYFKHRKIDLLDSFKTEIVSKVASLKGTAKCIAELNPWLRY